MKPQVNGTAALEYVPLGSLEKAPRNAKEHDLAAIHASIARFGFTAPLLIDERTERLVAGHGRLAVLQQMKDEGDSPPARIVAKAGDWLVPVIRGVGFNSDEDAEAYLIADNRLTELGGWDEALLLESLQHLSEADALNGIGFDEGDIAAFLAGQARRDGTDPDVIPEVPAKPMSRSGDLWLLGEHRLLCGDSRETAVLDRVTAGRQVDCLLTDPPYGIDLETDFNKPHGRVSGRTYRRVIGDAEPFDARFLRSQFRSVTEQFWFGANYYRRTLTPSDLDGSWLVWDKRSDETDVVAGSGFELCWSASKHKQDVLRFMWTNYTSQRNAGHRREHPTEKPVALLQVILERWSPDRAVVVDPFAGVGTTLLACELLDRIALLVEIDPAYCDVIVTRWENVTGQKATREREE